MCSKCFREHQQPQTTTTTRTPEVMGQPKSSIVQPAAQPAAAAAAASPPLQPPAAACSEPACADEPAVAAAAPASAQKTSTRCQQCRKKVGLTGFKCKCGLLFCGQHRYAEAHECAFDYKTSQREKLAAANPVVQAAKVERI